MTTPKPSPMAGEPVAVTELIRAFIVVLVSLGWITIDNDTANVVASAVGLALSWVLTMFARSKVTPVGTLTGRLP